MATKVEVEYKVGQRLRCNDVVGKVVPYKLPGDICVLWESGQRGSYDPDWLDEYAEKLEN